MNEYELALVVNAKITDEERAKVVEKAKGYITRFGGEVGEVEEWGKRKLAYEIEDETEGYYVLYNFESTPDYPVEIERRLNINENVLRSLVTVAVAK